ncbi:MAG: energy-coupling factor transporter ATPase [Mycoplasmataceae bacterium]|nr:energy-coupling factor transporter ATPase [Mycoplasmataceae bacterium]
MSDKHVKAVSFNNITFGYTPNVVTLDDISFTIDEGEYICVIGHNGSGKSTISKLMTGLLAPRSGTIQLFGETIHKTNIKYLRDCVGIIFQNPDNQFIGLTAEDDIAFGLENRRVKPNDIKMIIHKIAKLVNIEDLLTNDAANLSGGQKQRVAIASVLATNPKIIIFDESTSMLDPRSKMQIKSLMLFLKEKFNKTVISITHDMEEVVNADRVLVLKAGKLIESGTPSEIFEDRERLKNIQLDVPLTLQASKIFDKKNHQFEPTLSRTDFIEQILKRGKR